MTQRITHVAEIGLWTFAFSQRFYPTLHPRSYFQTRQRFSLPKHVTSGSMSPRSIFPTAQRFSFPEHVTSGSMSPQSLFPTSQRFPIPLPVMTSLDQSEARITCYLGAIYYSERLTCLTAAFHEDSNTLLFVSERERERERDGKKVSCQVASLSVGTAVSL